MAATAKKASASPSATRSPAHSPSPSPSDAADATAARRSIAHSLGPNAPAATACFTFWPLRLTARLTTSSAVVPSSSDSALIRRPSPPARSDAVTSNSLASVPSVPIAAPMATSPMPSMSISSPPAPRSECCAAADPASAAPRVRSSNPSSDLAAPSDPVGAERNSLWIRIISTSAVSPPHSSKGLTAGDSVPRECGCPRLVADDGVFVPGDASIPHPPASDPNRRSASRKLLSTDAPCAQSSSRVPSCVATSAAVPMLDPPRPPGCRIPARLPRTFRRCMASLRSAVRASRSPRRMSHARLWADLVATTHAWSEASPAARCRASGPSVRICAPDAPSANAASSLAWTRRRDVTRPRSTAVGCPTAHPTRLPPPPGAFDPSEGGGNHPSKQELNPSRNDSRASSCCVDDSGAPSNTVHRNWTCDSFESRSSKRTSGSDVGSAPSAPSPNPPPPAPPEFPALEESRADEDACPAPLTPARACAAADSAAAESLDRPFLKKSMARR